MSDDKNTETARQTDAAADATENQTSVTVSDATSDAATERTDAQIPDQAAGQTADQDEATDAVDAAVADASDADDTDDADDTAATKDADKSTLPDSVQFSVVFDDDDDSEDEATVDAGGDIYSSLASAEQSVADASDDGEAEEPADAVIDKDDVTAALIAAATGADPTKVKAAAGLSKSAAKVPDANDTHGDGPNAAEDGQSTQQGGDAAAVSSASDANAASAATDGTSASTSAGHHHAADPSDGSETVESAGAANTDASTDSKASNATNEPTEAERDALASANASAEVTERNARRVNETLALAKRDKKDELADHEASGAKSEPTMTLASRIDRVLVGGGADDVLLKTYPTFALNKVSVQDGKGKIVFGGVEFACYAGHAYALLIQDDPDSGVTADVKRRTLMGVMTGLVRPTAGTVMNKSANIADLEPVEVRGHRLGIVPQLHAVQPDLDAEQNVLYAMNASNRNFLKPKPVITRELLAKVGFTEATSGLAVGKLPLVQQRLVAIARAISTEAEVLILDEPTRGLGDDDTVTVFAALAKLAHSGGPKHCVIVLTASREIAEAADTLFEV